jgi:3-hydroxyisobutyrate dehydrogenase-like beta-hydroxyacid dehydrogenase
MGSRMAPNLVKNGFDVSVFDMSDDAVKVQFRPCWAL